MNICLEEVACPICGHKQYKKLFVNKDITYGVEGIYQVVECENCELWYQNPQPTKESIPFLYPEDYGPYTGKHVNKIEKILRKIENCNYRIVGKNTKLDYSLIRLQPDQDKHEKLLEIGCASGSRLIELWNMGYDNLYGTDISNTAQYELACRQIDFQCGDIEEVLGNYQNAEFKTVVMSMMLEHLKNPVYVLEEIDRILQPGGGISAFDGYEGLFGLEHI